MEKFRAICAMLLAALLCAALMGAAPPAPTALPLIQPAEASPESETVALGANQFAFDLSAALVKGVGDQNFVCSPYSVWVPLAALVNATKQPYKDELLQVLGASGIAEADLNAAASRMMYDLTSVRRLELNKEFGEGDAGIDPLKIANAVFVDDQLTINPAFARLFLDYYRGTAATVDFQSPSSADVVNQWVDEHTEGLVPSIVDHFSEDTSVAIANAIYFADRWTDEFDEGETADGIFHAPSGDATGHFMLREDDYQTYFEDDRLQAIQLPFRQGGGMYILLPKQEDAVSLLSSMTAEYFAQIVDSADLASGKLLLPRFSMASDTMNIKGALEKLGVPLFSRDNAPLTGGLVQEDLPMWASAALHKAVIRVDEKGTTAAAVTLVIAMGYGGPPPKPTKTFEMICDKPFAFVLYGNTYDGGAQVLFTGVVNRPEA